MYVYSIRSRDVELGATKNNISWQSERDFNPRPTDFKYGTLTTRPCCFRQSFHRKKFLPSVFCVVTNAAGHQKERIRSPGTWAPAKCNNQPGTQYSGVHPTASSALSLARTPHFVVRLDHLNTKCWSWIYIKLIEGLNTRIIKPSAIY